MISKLTGTVAHIYEQNLMIDVAGVGYQVFCNRLLLASWTAKEHIELF